jgi:hypothetical protein
VQDELLDVNNCIYRSKISYVTYYIAEGFVTSDRMGCNQSCHFIFKIWIS